MAGKVVARKSRIHGRGVFARVPIGKGERIIEYKGRLRTHDDVNRTDVGNIENGHTFLFVLNDQYVIDGQNQGNVARWINHGCAPNCIAVLEENAAGDARRDRIFIEAICDIAVGEELTYNYGIRLSVRHTQKLKKIWQCRCGAINCTRTILQPKR